MGRLVHPNLTHKVGNKGDPPFRYEEKAPHISGRKTRPPTLQAGRHTLAYHIDPKPFWQVLLAAVFFPLVQPVLYLKLLILPKVSGYIQMGKQSFS